MKRIIVTAIAFLVGILNVPAHAAIPGKQDDPTVPGDKHYCYADLWLENTPYGSYFVHGQFSNYLLKRYYSFYVGNFSLSQIENDPGLFIYFTTQAIKAAACDTKLCDMVTVKERYSNISPIPDSGMIIICQK